MNRRAQFKLCKTMPAPIDHFLRLFGVTPWQLLLGVACLGSWWATVQPLPGELKELNKTVLELSMRVEVHSVMLKQVEALTQEVKALRIELSRIKVEKSL